MGSEMCIRDSGILFNHESPLRGETFVTRKITRAVAAIELGLQSKVILGNLEAKRDWGHARDYVEGMWRIVQHDVGDDFVLATGVAHSVRDFVSRAFARTGRMIVWSGKGVDEIGKDKKTGEILVELSARYFRPTEVDHLVGDASKAKDILGWSHSISFDELVDEMVDADIEAIKLEQHTRKISSDV